MGRNSREVNLFAVVGAVAVGAAIGAAIGIFVAPKPGSELRDDICSRGRDFHNTIKSTGKDLLKKASSIGNNSSEMLDDEDELEEIDDFLSDFKEDITK